MSDKFILVGHEPKEVHDLLEWANWYETAERHVALTQVGDKRVSTVFLGLDHRYGEGPPLLFETMIFDGKGDSYQERCSTWEQAEEQHRKAVAVAAA